MSEDKELEKFDEAACSLAHFKEKVLDLYLKGTAEEEMAADALAARSLLPPMTATLRSFASISSEFPEFDATRCVACMECVIACPDAAIHARVNSESEVEASLGKLTDPAAQNEIRRRFAKADKFWSMYQKKGKEPGLFSLWIDPHKCKGCAECVTVCAVEHNALKMVKKRADWLAAAEQEMSFPNSLLPPTDERFIDPRFLWDLFLDESAWAYRGGSGACRGCGEIIALKMAMTATMAKHGKNFVMVAATGCNTVFSSTYPFNIFDVPWTNSLF